MKTGMVLDWLRENCIPLSYEYRMTDKEVVHASKLMTDLNKDLSALRKIECLTFTDLANCLTLEYEILTKISSLEAKGIRCMQ